MKRQASGARSGRGGHGSGTLYRRAAGEASSALAESPTRAGRASETLLPGLAVLGGDLTSGQSPADGAQKRPAAE